MMPSRRSSATAAEARANAYEARSRTFTYADRVANVRAGTSTAVMRSPGSSTVTRSHQFMTGHLAVSHQRADPDAAVGQLLDPRERHSVDVHDHRRAFHVQLHQVDECRAAGEIACSCGRSGFTRGARVCSGDIS